MTDQANYPFFPGGRPLWPTVSYERREAPITAPRKRDPKLDLTPRRSVTWKAPHGGAYSKAGA